MKNMVRVRYLLLTLAFAVFAVIQASPQMKIGNHPTQIHPASILELESNNQALRLTQGDTAAVNNVITSVELAPNSYDTTNAQVKAAEGMIMYQNSDHSLYMRVGGYWRQIVSSANVDSTFWKLKGNTGTDSATSFLGTLDKQPLNIGANNKGYIIIHSNGIVNVLADSSYFANNTGFRHSVTIADSLNVNNGAFKVSDSVYIGKPLAIHDSIVIKGLQRALTSDSLVLVMGSGGIVRKMNIDSIGIRSINGVTGTFFHLKFGTDSSRYTPWIDSISSKPGSTLILNIPDASIHARGLIDTVTQAFAGTKSFEDSVAIGQATKPNSTLQINGSVSMADTVVTSNISMTSAGYAFRTIIANVSGLTGSAYLTITLPSATGIDGRIYTFKKVGSTTDGQIANKVEIMTGGPLIDGDGTNFTLYNNFTSVTLQAQGGNWNIIGH